MERMKREICKISCASKPVSMQGSRTKNKKQKKYGQNRSKTTRKICNGYGEAERNEAVNFAEL